MQWTQHLPDSQLSGLLPAAVSPVVLIQGAIRVQPEGPVPPVPRPERKSIVPAPMPGNACPPEVDVSTGDGRSVTWRGEEGHQGGPGSTGVTIPCFGVLRLAVTAGDGVGVVSGIPRQGVLWQ